MAQVCDICGKKPQFGNTISHAHNVSRRRWNVNLRPVRAKVKGGSQAHARLHLLHAQRQSGQSLRTNQPQRTPRSTKKILRSSFLCEPSCPLWLMPLTQRPAIQRRRSESRSAESRPALRGPIGKIRRNPQLALAADFHAGNAFVPALDDLVATRGSKVNGSPRSTELSNFLPLVSHPV